MKSIITESIKQSMSYADYKELVKNLSESNSTTGNEKTEALANYTKLNDKRMKRWDKTIKITDDAKASIKGFNKSITWLVITESWCGDAAHIMPVMNKVADINEHISFKVVLRDENLDLMDAFLTNGGRSIPKLIMIDNASNEVLDTFGPRPSEATNNVNKFKEENGGLTPEFKEDLQRWYNKNKGQNIIDDLIKMLS